MSKAAPLPWAHLALALAIMIVWGTNFVIVRIALRELPPLLLATLRFAVVVAPAILFVRRPATSWWRLAAYGVLIGVGQFGLMFLAMRSSISPGLASLVVQTQVFFTVALAMRLNRETLRAHQWGALALAILGLGVILAHAGPGSATPLGLVLVLAAACSWAVGNVVARGAGPVNMLGFVVWSSLFAVPPLAALSLAIDGWPAIRAGLLGANATTWASVAWQSAGNSLFGYAAWGWLLARHPAATVTPMALLVPVFGMAASAWWLGEALPAWKLAAAGLITAGLALNLLWPTLSGWGLRLAARQGAG
jgi:O-acetylserine/cysteine efflux transporter